jgi:hypothetical protein
VFIEEDQVDQVVLVLLVVLVVIVIEREVEASRTIDPPVSGMETIRQKMGHL